MNQIAASAALLALIFLAGASDLRTRRIPNALTVTALGIARALRGATGVEPLYCCWPVDFDTLALRVSTRAWYSASVR